MIIRTSGSIVAATVILFVSMYFFDCSPVTTETATDEEPSLLQLSLEQIGRTTAEFSGAPIPATIVLDRDTVYNMLNWHTGKGFAIVPEGILNRKALKFTIDLYWTTYPLYKDTTDDFFYDTVWVSIGGSLKKSNKVIIKVINLPVVVDSARFDTMVFLGQDTIWQCSLPTAPQPSYAFTIFARDLDSKLPLIQMPRNNKNMILKGNNTLEMKYYPPNGDFRDTIDFFIFDQRGSQAFRTLLVKHITPNFLPVIDSIQVKSSILKASSMTNGMYRVAFTAFDTIPLGVFAHDTLGTLRRAVWKADKNSIIIDSTSSFKAKYLCVSSSCTDTLEDSSVVVDMITVTVYDDRGDSAVRRIELSKGKLNRPPQIGSLKFNGIDVVFTDTTAEVPAVGNLSHMLGLVCSDPEKEPLTIVWTGVPSSRFTHKTDSSLKYTAPAAIGTDTLRISISDGKLSIGRLILFSVSDIGPRFDSVMVGDTMLKGTDLIFAITGVPGDTLLCTAYGTDFDTGRIHDTMTYNWSSGGSGRFANRILYKALYILPDPIIKDTIILTLQDGEVQVVRRIVFGPANRLPVIDSITGNGVRLTGTAAFLSVTAQAADRFSFSAFAHDPEEGELTWLWSGADTLRFVSRVAASVKYQCVDSVYTDTVSITATDDKGARAVRKVILHVDTVTTP